jgi:hypothetical protein
MSSLRSATLAMLPNWQLLPVRYRASVSGHLND